MSEHYSTKNQAFLPETNNNCSEFTKQNLGQDYSGNSTELSLTNTVVFQNSPQMKRSSFFEHPDHPEEKSNQKFVVVVERTDFNLNSKQKDFYCKICQKKFTSKSEMTIHSKVHQGDDYNKSFKCHQCGKCFSTSGNLIQHSKTHGSSKPYACPCAYLGCTEVFNQQSHARQHYIRKHKDQFKYQCSFEDCSVRFKFFYQLKSHEDEHILNDDNRFGNPSSKNTFWCKIKGCNRFFASQRLLEIHKSNHKQQDEEVLNSKIEEECRRDNFQVLPRENLENNGDRILQNGKIKTVPCNFCSKIFSSRKAYLKCMEKCSMEEEKIKKQNRLNDIFHNNKNQDYEDEESEHFLNAYSCEQIENEEFECTGVSQQPINVEIQQQDHICIQHLAEVEKLTEGQKFIRHLLKEMRNQKKRVLKVPVTDQNGLQYSDEHFNYNVIQQNDGQIRQ